MTPTMRILVAGVGNIFRGDDAFGCEVVRMLITRPLSPAVRVVDFGTRGHDLAYALLEDYDSVVLVDAIDRGGEPGTLATLELEPDPIGQGTRSLNPHGVDLPAVFDLVRLMGGTLPQLYLVGCKPAEFGTAEEGTMGLSEPVAAAVDEAIHRITAIVDRLLATHQPSHATRTGACRG